MMTNLFFFNVSALMTFDFTLRGGKSGEYLGDGKWADEPESFLWGLRVECLRRRAIHVHLKDMQEQRRDVYLIIFHRNSLK